MNLVGREKQSDGLAALDYQKRAAQPDEGQEIASSYDAQFTFFVHVVKSEHSL